MNESQPLPLTYELVARGSGHTPETTIAEPAYRVIREAPTWQQSALSQVPAASQVDIDFEREVVLCVYRGEQPTGGYGISVQSMVLRGDTVDITLELSDPPAGSMLTQALTHPFAVYRIQVPEGASQLDDPQFRFYTAPQAEALTLQRLP